MQTQTRPKTINGISHQKYGELQAIVGGKWAGEIPYGFKRDSLNFNLIHIEKKAAVEILALYISIIRGYYGFSRGKVTAKDLWLARCLPQVRHTKQYYRMLSNVAYKGDYQWKKQVIFNHHTHLIIVPPKIFDQVQQIGKYRTERSGLPRAEKTPERIKQLFDQAKDDAARWFASDRKQEPCSFFGIPKEIES